MAYIVVQTFTHEDDAKRVHDYLRDANLISMADTAIVVKDEESKIHIKNETHMGRDVGAVGGGLLALLIGGVIFPVGGIVPGALAGGLLGKAVAPQIDASFIKDVSESLSPGDSAIFIYIREDTPDDVLESMKEYKGKIHYTSLPAETEEQLRSAMAGLDGKPVDLSE